MQHSLVLINLVSHAQSLANLIGNTQATDRLQAITPVTVYCHQAIQPDNRITRHCGFWKSLRNLGITIPTGEFVEEEIHKSEDGLRVFGAVQPDANQVEAIHSVLAASQGVMVVTTRNLSAK